ncbi:MAG TPA: hypothetical protein ENL04_01945 [Sulfuricurvum sp.]|nr:hypothetical protein [Sulfuricurvum sp.]
MISEEHFKNLQKSAPKVADNIHEITERTFTLLLDAHPELKVLFKDVSREYPSEFGSAVLALSSLIDRPDKLQLFAEKFKAMHPSVSPEAFGLMFESLLRAMKQVMGLKAPPKAINAWDAAITHFREHYL